MSNIPNFNNFEVNEAIVAAGFGMNNIQNFGLGGGTPQTGYSMNPIAGVVESCSNHVAEQANMYESNDNDDHTAKSYMKEAKKHINEAMDNAYENYSSMDEAMVQVAGKDKPSGAKVLSTVICEALVESGLKLDRPSDYKKACALVQDVIIKSTF
tara:strand:- start:1816 stop:2280 length:465 start_codon:yes stop_codon:yes gene_type:complete